MQFIKETFFAIATTSNNSQDVQENITQINSGAEKNKNSNKGLMNLIHKFQNKSIDILTSGLLPINKDYILEYKKDEHDKIDQESKTKCKIIKFFSEWSYEELLAVTNEFNQKIYQNLFIFIFEIDDLTAQKTVKTKEFETLKQLLLKFAPNRPLILQLTSKTQKTAKIFFKEDNSKVFVEIKKQSGKSEKFENFQSFLEYFLYSKNENFQEVLIENLPCIENSTSIIRFLKTLTFPEEFFEDLALKCGLNGTKKDLLAALDVSFEHKGEIMESESTKCLSYSFQYPKSAKSVLSNALDGTNSEIIDFLIKDCKHLIEGIPFDHKIDISTAAFKNHKIPLLCDLLDLCDFPFPKDFDESTVKDKRLQKIIKGRTDFHKAIESENFEQINKFIEQNSVTKNAFDMKNDSALYKALSLKKYNVMFHLKSHGYCAVEFNDYKIIITDANELKTAQKFAAIQRFKNVNSALPNMKKSVYLLVTRSFIHNKNISMETQTRHYDKIKEWLEEIYRTDENRLIFDVAAISDFLKVIFDFESELSSNIDLSHSNAEGVTYPKSGWIMIGAKSSNIKNREQKIKGVIAHEFTHFVMRIVYENDEKPYYKEDKRAEKLFTEITEEIKEMVISNDDECNGIISSVFLNYKPEDHHVELIVTVLQILAEFSNDVKKISYLRIKFKRLFAFYRDHVMPDLKKFLESNRDVIRNFNKSSGVLVKMKEMDLEFTNLDDTNFLTERQLTVVTSNQPKLLLHNIFTNLCTKYGTLVDVKNIFMTLRQFNVSKQLEQIISKNSNLNVFVDCSEGIGDSLSSIINGNETNFAFIVSNGNDKEKLTGIINEMKLNKKIDISWNNISTKSREKLLQTKINIRNRKISVFELFSKPEDGSCNSKQSMEERQAKFSNIINDQLLNLLLNKSEISINTDYSSGKTDNYFDISFVPRKFIEKVQFQVESEESIPSVELSEVQLIEDVKNEKVVLISDLAGAGKSWALQSLIDSFEKSNPSNWLSKVDLKQHIKAFKSEQQETPEFSSYLITNILKPENKFEPEMFKEMYKNGKAYIFFDGFDEIAPDCAGFVTKLTKSFKHNGGNQLWIATRDYFEIDLQKELDIKAVYKLNPFTEEDEIELITTSWILSDEEAKVHANSRNDRKSFIQNHKNYADYRKKAKALNAKIATMKGTSVGLPQFYKILVKVLNSSNSSQIDLTIFKIYDKFVNILCERWSHEKGDIRKKASIEILSKFFLTFQELHIYFAMRGLYPEFVIFCGLKFNCSSWSEEEIIACGIMTKKGESFYFIHETFREFFAAKFIVRALLKGNIDQDFSRFFIDFLTVSKYEIIRIFLNEAFNDHVIMSKIEASISLLADYFYKNVDDIYFYSSISEKNLQNLMEIIKRILKCGSNKSKKEIMTRSIEKCRATHIFSSQLIEFAFSILDIDSIQVILLKKNIYGDNFIHDLVDYSKVEVIENIFKILKEKFDDAQYEEILKSKGSFGRNLLQKTVVQFNAESTKQQFLWKFFRNFCVTDEEFINYIQQADYDNNNIIHLSVFSFTNNIFKFLIEDLSKFTSRIFIRMILSTLGNNQQNFLQMAATLNKALYSHKTFWKIVSEYFVKTEIIEIIKHVDKDGRNILQLAAYYNSINVVSFLWDEVLMKLDDIDILNVLYQTDHKGCNIFHFCACARDERMLRTLWMKIKAFYTSLNLSSNFKDFVQQTFADHIKIFHLNPIDSEKYEFCESLWNLIFISFENEQELYDLVIDENNKGNNILSLLVRKNKANKIEKILKICKKKFSTTHYENFLKLTVESKKNLLQFAACQSKDLKTNKLLWNTFRDLCKFDEKFIEYLKQKHECGNNVLHFAVHSSTSEIFEFMIEELKILSSNEKIKTFLSTYGCLDQNILHIAAFGNSSLKLHENLWKVIELYFSKYEIMEMIFHFDSNMDYILHCAVTHNTREICDFTWSKIKTFLTDEEMIEYLKVKGSNNQNIFEKIKKTRKKDIEMMAWGENLYMTVSESNKGCILS